MVAVVVAMVAVVVAVMVLAVGVLLDLAVLLFRQQLKHIEL
jgi:hypothetical protein